MKWLRDRILRQKPGRRGILDEEAVAKQRMHDAPRPRLVFLVHDAAGPAAYRLHTFEDAASGAEFIQFWFPPMLEHGTLAFWAAHQEPAVQPGSNGMQSAEVVVMIRDEARPDIVYPFSFSDMGLAHSWIAREVEKDLRLRSVLVYWATPVRISTDHWGTVCLEPAQPPASHPTEPPATPAPAELANSTALEVERLSQAEAVPAGEPPAELDGTAGNTEGAREVPHILREANEVVRHKRWRQREEPFRGFGSPPGKF